MGANLPTTIPDLINWATVHGDLWVTNAAAIGLSPAQATAFKTLATGMVSANTAAETARQASKDATLKLQDAVDAVRTTGGAYVNLIKAYAETTGNPGVYTLAGVSPSSPPGTLPAPVPPQRFAASVNGDGSLTITWKVAQPAGLTGVQYLVSRRMADETAFTLISSQGRNKSFTDTGLPVGIDRVEYIVQPKRGEVLGVQSNIFAVQFGSVKTGGGAMTIAATASLPNGGAEPMKLAA